MGLCHIALGNIKSSKLNTKQYEVKLNIFKKVKDYLGSKTKSFWTTGFRSFFFSENAFQPTNKDYLDSYDSCHLVFSCTKKIGEKVASVEKQLYQIKGSLGKEVITEVKDHEILDLLAKPNKFMTGFELFKGISIDLDLMGNSYIYKAKGEKGEKEKGKTLELWPLRPDWVKIIPDDKKIIGGYEYRVPGGEMKKYEFEEVIHIKEVNPKSAFYGLPTVKPALEIIKSLVYATRWNMNFFYNSARPDFLLFSEFKMKKEDKEELKEMWQSQFGGLEKSHRFGILHGKETRIEKLTQTMKDMDFDKLTKSSTDQILAAFGVPKSIIGMMGMNRAEAEAQIYTFLSETVEPRYKMINEKLNEFLVSEFSETENLYLDYVDPTPENREAITKEYEMALKNNWMVINEVRDKEGLPPLDGGWDFYLPVAMIPAGGVPEGDRTKMFRVKGIDARTYYADRKRKEEEELRRRVMAGKKKLKTVIKLKNDLAKMFAGRLRIIKELSFTAEKKQELWNEHSKLLTGDEKIFKTMVVKLFESQRKRVIAALKEEFGKAVGGSIDWTKEKNLFIKVSAPFFTSIVESRGKRAAALVGSTFEMTTEVRKFIKDKTILFADQVNETTRKKLKKTLSEGVAEGEGIDEITTRVNKVFDTRTKYESERIARTEVLGSSNGAELEAYRQSEVVEKKEWSATMDDRVRPEHAAINGEIVDLNKSFSNGLMFPSEPNCRCAILPVVE